jgi:hypothetical protein
MHRLTEDHLEEILSGAGLAGDHPALLHLDSCQECRFVVGLMREQSALLQDLRVPAEIDPHPGFYARVLDRIEAQKPVSIWSLFAESWMGRALAPAALAMVLLMGGFLLYSEPSMPAIAAGDMVRDTYPMLPAADFPDEVFDVSSMPRYENANMARGAVLMNLASYQGH